MKTMSVSPLVINMKVIVQSVP